MSTATAEPRVGEHPAERKALLKKSGRSENAELTEPQVKALDALPKDASTSAIESALKGKATKAQRVAVKYPDDVRAAYEKALELTGTPEAGGPKYALTIKQTAAIKHALAAKGKAVGEVRKGLDNVSDAQLRKIAKGTEASMDATRAVRAFLKAHPALREDRTMYARKGAAIVLAFREAA